METDLEQKLLALILEEKGLASSEEALAQLGENAEIHRQIAALVDTVTLHIANQQETTPPVAEADPPPADVDQPDQPPETSPQQPEENPPQSGQEAEEWQKMPYENLNDDAPQPPLQDQNTVLKPGQIPAAAAQPLAPTPGARIVIANARVGAPFNFPVDIALDNGAVAQVKDVVFASPVGLTFDPATGNLSGIPTQSGDFEVTVVWASEAHPSGSTTATFIVNPDPRSLWKNIDPPEDDRYFKKNVEHQLIRQPGVNIAAASRRGRSHAHVGSFRDDDLYVNWLPDSGWSVMLVADGAGSAKNSRQGSRIATETAGNYLVSQLKGEKGLDLKKQILQWNTENQRQVWEGFYHLYRQASVLAVNNIHNEAIITDEKTKSYATTLLAVVSFREGDELFAASFWLGDGAIAAYGPAGKVRVLGTPDSGEYAGQTRFLDAEAVQDPEFSKRIIIGRWQDISHLVLMTDGVSDPRFETDNGLQNPQKWDALIAELAPCLNDADSAAENLAEWLNFFSPGNHDDRTIIVSW